jgi:hypothetical protein
MTSVSLLGFLGYVCLGGAIGGLLGELVEGGLFVPHKSPDGSLDLGFIRNILFGAAAGAIAQMDAFKKDSPHGSDILAAALSALLVGIGGVNWIKSKLDAKTNQTAAALMAGKPADQEKATRILAAKSAHEVLQIAREQ